MKQKHIKLFENFQEMDPKLVKTLKTIANIYKSEFMGSTEHTSEYFGDGDSLKKLVSLTSDEKIKRILNKTAECCKEECEGSAEHIGEWLYHDDYDYIADLLDLPSIDDEEDDLDW